MNCIENIKNKVDEIYVSLTSNKISDIVSNKGLMDGQLGILLFLLFYNDIKQDETINRIVNYKFNTYLNNLSFIDEGYNYANGICGILKTLNLLNRIKLTDIDISDIPDKLSDFILSCIKARDLKIGNYDLLYGYVGVGMYAIEFKDTKLLTSILNVLEKTQINDSRNISKWENVDFNQDKKSYNISLSHGMSAIVIFLCKYYSLTGEAVAKELATRAISYLLSQKLNVSIYGTYFPMMPKEEKYIFPSRLAWCYGDLCQALALWHAYKTFKNESWGTMALEIFTHSTYRIDSNTTGVTDAILCHGSSGLSQIFTRMYLETGFDIFQKAADYWTKTTLEYAHFEDGLAGFKTDIRKDFVNSYGFLDGISGIGLSLLTQINPARYSAWDELLLIS